MQMAAVGKILQQITDEDETLLTSLTAPVKQLERCKLSPVKIPSPQLAAPGSPSMEGHEPCSVEFFISTHQKKFPSMSEVLFQ